MLQGINAQLAGLAGRDLYSCTLQEVRQCRSFLQRARQQDYAARYCRLVSGLDEDSLDCVGSILGRVELVASLQDRALRGGHARLISSPPMRSRPSGAAVRNS